MPAAHHAHDCFHFLLSAVVPWNIDDDRHMVRLARRQRHAQIILKRVRLGVDLDRILFPHGTASGKLRRSKSADQKSADEIQSRDPRGAQE